MEQDQPINLVILSPKHVAVLTTCFCPELPLKPLSTNCMSIWSISGNSGDALCAGLPLLWSRSADRIRRDFWNLRPERKRCTLRLCAQLDFVFVVLYSSLDACHTWLMEACRIIRLIRNVTRCVCWRCMALISPFCLTQISFRPFARDVTP